MRHIPPKVGPCVRPHHSTESGGGGGGPAAELSKRAPARSARGPRIPLSYLVQHWATVGRQLELCHWSPAQLPTGVPRVGHGTACPEQKSWLLDGGCGLLPPVKCRQKSSEHLWNKWREVHTVGFQHCLSSERKSKQPWHLCFLSFFLST